MKQPIVLLFVDDSPTVHKVVELAFDTEDVRVVAAQSGEEALEKTEQQRPDIVIADISMTGMTGYDLCGRLKSRPETADVPVFLLASSTESYDEEKGREARADGHILKPFKSGDLVNLVKEKACSTWNIPEESETPAAEFDSPFPLEEAAPGGVDFDPLTATAMVKVENFGSELLPETGVEGTDILSIHDPEKTVEFEPEEEKPRSEVVFTRETDDNQVEREILKEDLLAQTGEILGIGAVGGIENIFAENTSDLDRLEQDILAATGGGESLASEERTETPPEAETSPPSKSAPVSPGMLELGSNIQVEKSGGAEADEETEEEYSYEVVEENRSGLSGEALSLLKEAGIQKPVEEGSAEEVSGTPAASAGASEGFDRFFGEKGAGLPELTDDLVKIPEVGFIPGPVPRKEEPSPGRDKEKLLREIKTLFPDTVPGPLQEAFTRWAETALESSLKEVVEKEVKKLLPDLLKKDGPVLIRSAFQAAWDKSLPEIRKSVENLTRRVVAEILEKQGHKPQ